MAKKKGQKSKQRSTKHTHKTKDRKTRASVTYPHHWRIHKLYYNTLNHYHHDKDAVSCMIYYDKNENKKCYTIGSSLWKQETHRGLNRIDI